MSILIKQVKVVYPTHKLNGKHVDILIDQNKIMAIDGQLNVSADRIIDASEMLLFPSLVDAHCSIGEPGFEFKEDLRSAANAAKNGGFGTLLMLPDTNPCIDNRGQLEYIFNRSNNLGIEIIPFGTISKQLKGEELSEMFDLNDGGAIAFTDGKHAIKDVNLMKRALEYTLPFKGIVCSFPFDDRLNPGSMVHESKNNIKLGIKSAPSLSETLMVSRDLSLQNYCGGQLHFSAISAKESVQLIAEAKNKGQNVSCAVPLVNLLYTDERLEDFDSNFKTLPHLREIEDKNALIEGLKNGTIDMIVADHTPENIENKDLEFDHASFGMIMLETALSMINEQLSHILGWETIIDKFSISPRNRFGLKQPDLELGHEFNFALFDPNASWVYDSSERRSKSANSPLHNSTLLGKVVLV